MKIAKLAYTFVTYIKIKYLKELQSNPFFFIKIKTRDPKK